MSQPIFRWVIQEQESMMLLICINSNMKVLKNGKFKILKIWELDFLDLKKMIPHLLQVINRKKLLDLLNMRKTVNSSPVRKLQTKTLLKSMQRTTNMFQAQEHIRMLNLLLTGFQKVQLHIE